MIMVEYEVQFLFPIMFVVALVLAGYCYGAYQAIKKHCNCTCCKCNGCECDPRPDDKKLDIVIGPVSTKN